MNHAARLAALVTCLALSGQLAAQSNVVYSISTPAVLSGEAAEYTQSIREILDLEIQRKGYQRLDFWLPNEYEPLPVAVEVTFGVVSVIPRLHMFLQITDTERGVLVASTSGRLPANVSLYNGVVELFAEVEPALKRYLALISSVPDPVAPPVIAKGVVFTASQPIVLRNRVTGMVVSVSEETGESQIDFVENAILPLTVSAPGFAPRDVDAKITAAEPVSLPRLTAEPHWSASIHTSLGRFAGVGLGARYFFPGARWHLTQEIDTFATVSPGAPTFYYHIEPRSLVGVVVADGRILTASVGTGLGAVVTRRAGANALTYLDSYWNVFHFELGGRIGAFTPFLRVGMNYAFETERGLFSRGINTPSTNPLLVAGVARQW